MSGIQALGRWHEYRGHAKNTKFHEEVGNKALSATFNVVYTRAINILLFCD